MAAIIPLSLTGKVTAWFAKHGLKWIAYGLLAVCIAIGTLVYYGYQRRGALKRDIASLQTSVEILSAANKTNQETIRTLQQDAYLDDALITGLDERLKSIDTADRAQTARIANLEKNNAEVRAWLRTPTPAGVGCVLDDSCDTNGNRASPTKQKSAPTVR
jgi:hypothetical protein